MANPTNAILISWDGAQRAHVNECLKAGQLPNLAALMKEGRYADIDVVTHATCTKPGHSEMLTGCCPVVTGVLTNEVFQPIPEGLTIFERLETFFGKDKIVTVMLTGKTHHLGGDGPTTGVPKGAKKRNPKAKPREIPGEPFFLSKKGMDVFDSNSEHADMIGPKAVGYIDKYGDRKFFFFFHFSDPDSAGHKSGENSEEYTKALIDCDEWLGKIIAKLKDRGLCGKTVLYVNTDHGMDEGLNGHKASPDSWLVTNDLTVKHGGVQADITPTILKTLGVDVETLQPQMCGTPLQYEKPGAEEHKPKAKTDATKGKGKGKGKQKPQ